MSEVRIFTEPFDPHDALRDFSRTADDMGALASFTGYCRAKTQSDAVTALELQAYPGFTERVIAEHAEALQQKTGVAELLVLHRHSLIAPGDAIVLAAARARHRTEAFAAVEQMMDWLKTDAPFWKREYTQSGARWIEPTAQDYARRAACR